MIEFALPTISKYLVGTWLVRIDKSKLNKSANDHKIITNS